MKKSIAAISLLLSFNIIGCLSVTNLIPEVKTIDDQGRPIETLGKKLSLASEDKEIQNIYITTSARIDRSKIKLVESSNKTMTIDAYIYANSESDFNRLLSNVRYDKNGYNANVEVASGSYFCLRTENVSYGTNYASAHVVKVNGVCLDSIFISVPTGVKINIYVNNAPVYSFRPLKISEIINAIEKESFDDAKLKIIQTFVDSQTDAKYITSDEVTSIVDLLTFSSGKKKTLKLLTPGMH